MKSRITKWTLMSLSVLILTALYSCKDDEGAKKEAEPAVLSITDENDAEIDAASPGDIIFINGTALSTATVQINATDVSPAIQNDEVISIQIPSAVPTVATDPDVANELTVTFPGKGENGEDLIITESFRVLPAGPTVSSISNEFAPAGEEITIKMSE